MTLNHDQIFNKMDLNSLLKMSRYAGGHDEQMKGLIKGAKVIAHWNEGDYQGQVATILKVDFTTFMVYSDYYGSCGGCDSWEDASDENVEKMCRDLVYTSKIFSSLKKVILFLRDRENDFEDDVSVGLLGELKNEDKK